MTSAQDLVVATDYGQIYIYSHIEWPDDPEEINVFHDALDDALDTKRYVGSSRGCIDLVTPGQWNWETPMRVELWSGEPSLADTADWDHEVDIDFDAPEGGIVFEPSGGSARSASASLPPGLYRMRVSGRGFGDRGTVINDSYRLRLWPRHQDSPPVLRKCWPRWGRLYPDENAFS
ncbi:hypothetical protein [Actinomadura sp. WAC 06369]|uniref:hypothetical protein n=1 Tax=Actinomadura sp. WAC 06369 TaxID=2203193 RepID=UPI000F794816|nr:hypothetical protein [Actinomadura sp. WAC 06369]RSN70134.1 hypothetical protein DMH08_06550 [Actinomadura sp. WAC 06369]